MPSFVPFAGDELPPITFETSKIVVLPLCYERSASYGQGSGNGPLHILNASTQLERMDEEIFVDWGELDIHTALPVMPSGDPFDAVMEMKAAARPAIESGKFLLALGGDHASSIGPIMAAAEIFPDVGVLQIDAHADLRQQYNGSIYNHACVMRRVIDDLGLPAVQVGIRSFSKEEHIYMQEKKLMPFFAHNLTDPDNAWVESVVEKLPQNVYLTLDLDGLDPSVIPGTGTPEPGGLTYRQILFLLRTLGQKRNVIAADINELVKIKGTNVSEFTAAKLATKIFIYCARPFISRISL